MPQNNENITKLHQFVTANDPDTPNDLPVDKFVGALNGNPGNLANMYSWLKANDPSLGDATYGDFLAAFGFDDPDYPVEEREAERKKKEEERGLGLGVKPGDANKTQPSTPSPSTSASIGGAQPNPTPAPKSVQDSGYSSTNLATYSKASQDIQSKKQAAGAVWDTAVTDEQVKAIYDTVVDPFTSSLTNSDLQERFLTLQEEEKRKNEGLLDTPGAVATVDATATPYSTDSTGPVKEIATLTGAYKKAYEQAMSDRWNQFQQDYKLWKTRPKTAEPLNKAPGFQADFVDYTDIIELDPEILKRMDIKSNVGAENIVEQGNMYLNFLRKYDPVKFEQHYSNLVGYKKAVSDAKQGKGDVVFTPFDPKAYIGAITGDWAMALEGSFKQLGVKVPQTAYEQSVMSLAGEALYYDNLQLSGEQAAIVSSPEVSTYISSLQKTNELVNRQRELMQVLRGIERQDIRDGKLSKEQKDAQDEWRQVSNSIESLQQQIKGLNVTEQLNRLQDIDQKMLKNNTSAESIVGLLPNLKELMEQQKKNQEEFEQQNFLQDAGGLIRAFGDIGAKTLWMAQAMPNMIKASVTNDPYDKTAELWSFTYDMLNTYSSLPKMNQAALKKELYKGSNVLDVNWDAMLWRGVNQTGQVAWLLSGSSLIGKAGIAAGMGETAALRLGLMANTYGMIMPEYYVMARNAGANPREAMAIGSAQAGMEALIESINPMTSAAAMFGHSQKKKMMKEFVKKWIKGGAVGKKEAMKYVLKEFGKDIIGENIEEILAAYGGAFINKGFNHMTGVERYNGSLPDSKELIETAILTSIATGAISFNAAANNYQLAAMHGGSTVVRMEMASNPLLAMQVLEENFKRGTITEEQFNQYREHVTRMSYQYDSLVLNEHKDKRAAMIEYDYREQIRLAERAGNKDLVQQLNEGMEDHISRASKTSKLSDVYAANQFNRVRILSEENAYRQLFDETVELAEPVEQKPAEQNEVQEERELTEGEKFVESVFDEMVWGDNLEEVYDKANEAIEKIYASNKLTPGEKAAAVARVHQAAKDAQKQKGLPEHGVLPPNTLVSNVPEGMPMQKDGKVGYLRINPEDNTLEFVYAYQYDDRKPSAAIIDRDSTIGENGITPAKEHNIKVNKQGEVFDPMGRLVTGIIKDKAGNIQGYTVVEDRTIQRVMAPATAANIEAVMKNPDLARPKHKKRSTPVPEANNKLSEPVKSWAKKNKVKRVLDRLRVNFGANVVVDKAEYEKAVDSANISPAAKKYRKENGLAIVVENEDGSRSIFINPDKAYGGTLVHEYGHVWFGIVNDLAEQGDQQAKDILSLGKQIAKQSVYYPMALKFYGKRDGNGKLLNEEEVVEEALMLAIEDRFNKTAGGTLNQFKMWMYDFINKVMESMGVKNFRVNYWNASLGKGDVMEMSMEDMADFILADMFATGERIAVPITGNGQGMTDSKFSIIGEIGAGRMDPSLVHNNLANAKKMESANKDPKTIRIATGWERAVDGKWRYETPYNLEEYEATMSEAVDLLRGFVDNPNRGLVTKGGDILSDHVLKAYPQFEDMKISIFKENVPDASYDVRTKEIEIIISDYMNREEAVFFAAESLIHEVQHAIQDVEGFNNGSNLYVSLEEVDLYKKLLAEEYGEESEVYKEVAKRLDENSEGITAEEAYLRNSGEVEARNAVERAKILEGYLPILPLKITEDVSRSDQILMNGIENVAKNLMEENAIPRPQPRFSISPVNDAKNKEFIDKLREVGTPHPFQKGAIFLEEDVLVEASIFDGDIILDSILSINKGKGKAAKALDKFLKIADDVGVTVRLTAKPFGETNGLTQQQLMGWYGSRGFIPVNDWSGDMYRPPAGNSATDAVYEDINAQKKEAEERYGVDIVVEYDDVSEAFIVSEVLLDDNNIYLYDVIDSEAVPEEFDISGLEDEIAMIDEAYYEASRANNSNARFSLQDIQLEYNEKGQHLAPNGKPSNLTEAQAKQVRTPEFKAWFGDWENDPKNASKVVDENGEPLVVYHGSSERFTEFDEAKKGSRGGLDERFFAFTTNKWVALQYGRISAPYFLNVRKLPTYDNKGKTYDKLRVDAGYKKATLFDLQRWHSEGFKSIGENAPQFEKVDGFSVKNTIEADNPNNDDLTEYVGDTYYVARPNQIKSARFNSGQFDSSNPDTRFSILPVDNSQYDLRDKKDNTLVWLNTKDVVTALREEDDRMIVIGEKSEVKEKTSEAMATITSTGKKSVPYLFDQNGSIKAVAGRHFLATAELMGIEKVPVEVPKYQQKVFEERFKQPSPEVRFSIIGSLGASQSYEKSADLMWAQFMESRGDDATAIRLQTGWERDLDGRWKMWIAPDEFVIKNHSTDPKDMSIKPLSEMVDMPEVFKYYPQLKDYKARILIQGGVTTKVYGSGRGKYRTGAATEAGTLDIDVAAHSMAEAIATLQHEVQHAIQEIEGFAKGADFRSMIQAKEAQWREAVKEWHKWNEAGDTKQREEAAKKVVELTGRHPATVYKSDLYDIVVNEAEVKSRYRAHLGEAEARLAESLNVAPESLLKGRDVAPENVIIVHQPSVYDRIFLQLLPKVIDQGSPLTDNIDAYIKTGFDKNGRPLEYNTLSEYVKQHGTQENVEEMYKMMAEAGIFHGDVNPADVHAISERSGSSSRMSIIPPQQSGGSHFSVYDIRTKSFGEKVSDLWKTWMVKSMTLASDQYKLVNAARGKVDAAMRAAAQDAAGVRRALQKRMPLFNHYIHNSNGTSVRIDSGGSVTMAEVQSKINDALSQADPADRNDARNWLHANMPEIVPMIDNMREKMDQLSLDLYNKHYITDGVRAAIDHNFGFYMTRSYRAFDNLEKHKKWLKNDPAGQKAFKDGVDFIHQSYGDYYFEQYVAHQDLADKETDGRKKAAHQRRADYFREKWNKWDLPRAKAKALDLMGFDQAQTAFEAAAGVGLDVDVLKKRKDMPEPIRRMLGEYKDPLLNYQRTVYNITKNIALGEAMDALISQGINQGWVVDVSEMTGDAKPQGYSRINMPGALHDTYKDLAVPNEINEAISEFMLTAAGKKSGKVSGKALDALANAYYSVLSGVKWAKTIGSVQTHVRNMVGNSLFAIGNQHTNPELWKMGVVAILNDIQADPNASGALKYGGMALISAGALAVTAVGFAATAPIKIADVFTASFNNTTLTASTQRHLQRMGYSSTTEIINDLIERGVMDSDVGVQELRALVRDAGFKDGMSETAVQNAWKKFMNSSAKTANAIYQAEDNVYKIVGYMHELERYMRFYNGQPNQVEKARDRAADAVNNMYPNYGSVSNAVKFSRKLPLAGTFVSFPAEAIRLSWSNPVHHWQDFKEAMEMKNSEMAVSAAQRLLWLTGTHAAAVAVAPLVTAMISGFGLEERIRKFLPPWMKNSQIVAWKSSDKEYTVMDVSFVDPYSIVHKPSMLAMRAALDPGSIDLETAARAMAETLNPFTEEDLTLTKLLDVSRNKKKGTNYQVYYESDDAGTKLMKSLWHIADAAIPGTYKSVERIYKASTGVSSDYGRSYDLDTELLAMFTGFRMNTYDIENSLYFRIKDEYEGMERARDEQFNKELYKLGPNATIEDRMELYNKANELAEKHYNEILETIDAAKYLNLGIGSIAKIVTGDQVKFNKELEGAIMGGAPYHPQMFMPMEKYGERIYMGPNME